VREVDYIIVGLGLAGIAFCEELIARKKTFFVFDAQGDAASKVAAGLYNPVILKRYTLPWKALEQFPALQQHWDKLGERLSGSIHKPISVRKIFTSVEDQNNWFTASGQVGLSHFIKPTVTRNTNAHIEAPFHFGEVQHTGKVDIKKLISGYTEYLERTHAFAKAYVDHSKIELTEKGVRYQDIEASHIVFAEGYGMKKNPFFSALPLVGNKGEYIYIKAPDLKLNEAIKSSFFVIPVGDDTYQVGATFNWKDKDCLISTVAREELEVKLKTVIHCDYEVIAQEAGIRPTTGDRRPLVGVHPKHKQLALLNGLGTRGTMMSPYLAQCLIEHLEEGKPLPEEIDIMRFPKKFS